MKLTVDSLEWEAEKSAMMAGFGKPWSRQDIEDLKNHGFSPARGLAASCMKWVWSQWLLGGSADQIRAKVGAFVESGMTLQKKSAHFYMRPHADL